MNAVDHSRCCAIHGCRHAELNCPIITGEDHQAEPCHHCERMGLSTVDDINAYLGRGNKTCPHCGQAIPRSRIRNDRPIKGNNPEETWDHYNTAI